MANINIKLSQAVVNTMRNIDPADAQNGVIGSFVDLALVADYEIAKNYSTYQSWTYDGSTLRLAFSDGATATYSNVVLSNPNGNGTASATGVEFNAPGALSFSEKGSFVFDYQIVNGGPSFDLASMTVNEVKFATHLSPGAVGYSPITGNVSFTLNGNVKVDNGAWNSGYATGTISRLEATTEKYYKSSVLEGNFTVLANTDLVGAGQGESYVRGTISSYTTAFNDGSYANMTNAAYGIDEDDVMTIQQLLSYGGAAGRLDGNDVVNLELPSRMYEKWYVQTGSGDDQITLKGGGGDVFIYAGSGNDTITVLDSNKQWLNGDRGTDTVIFNNGMKYTVNHYDKDYFQLMDSTGELHSLTGIERVKFADKAVALDVDGIGGQAYRIYQAAFDRTPDKGGVGFWMNSMDKGVSLLSVAEGFMQSNEFKAMYGAAPSNKAFVDKLYINVLDRPGEAAGVAFWLGHLNAGNLTQAQVLAEFSESDENYAAVIGQIQNGFEYTPYGG